MTKVSDMIGSDPHDYMRVSDHETAVRVAGEIRAILLPLCERAAAYDAECAHDDLFAAWDHLNAGERRAWKELVSVGYAHRR